MQLQDARVIAGGPNARKQFCTLACYDLWKRNAASK
jgi:hypothetical protein